MKFASQKLLAALLVTASVGATLSACVPLVPLMVGGGFVGGAMVATDRRTSGSQLEPAVVFVKTSVNACMSMSPATTAKSC